MSKIILAKIMTTLHAIRLASDSLNESKRILVRPSNKSDETKQSTESKPSSKDKSEVFFYKKKHKDMTPEEREEYDRIRDHEKDRLSLERYIERMRLQKGVLIFEEGKNDKEIKLIKEMLSAIINQPEDDSKNYNQILFEKSFARNILGRQDKKASKDPKLLRTFEDFTPEEIEEIEQSLFQKEYVGDGIGWERTTPEGDKIYVITSRQLSFLTQCFQNIKTREEERRKYEELAKQNPKKYKLKSKSEPELKNDSDSDPIIE
jgi:hypothetical protein